MRCIDCDCALFDSETVYSVIKHIVGEETVFEMAICMDCSARMREQYSEETSRNLHAFIETKLREKMMQTMDRGAKNSKGDLEEEVEFTVSDGLVACAFCGKPRQDCHRFEIVGLFFEDEIVLESGHGISFSSPMMLCQECNSQVSKLISKQTRETWDRFVEDHFDGPPGIEIDGPKMEPIMF